MQAEYDLYAPPHASADGLSENARIAGALLSINKLDEASFRAKYGPKGYDLLSLIYEATNSNALRYWDDMVAVGGRTGFKIGCLVCDYAEPEKIARGENLGGHYSALQPSNLNLQRRAPRAFENQIFYKLRQTNAAWCDAMRELGLDPNKYRHPGNRTISRIQRALISDAIRRAIPDERQAALYVLARHVPSLSGKGADILSLRENTNQQRDTLNQIPALMLYQRGVQKWVQGKRKKNILDDLGLPRSTEKLLPAAVGAISGVRGFAGNPFRDADIQQDISWFSGAVGNALPKETFKQRKIATIATRLSCEIDDAPCCQRIAQWLCKEVAKIKTEAELRASFSKEWALHDYLAAPTEMLSAAALRPFNDQMSLQSVLKAADDYEQYLRTLNGLEGPPFPFPQWAWPSVQLPKSKWRLVRIKSPAELFVEARRFDNCAASKVSACRHGLSVLYTIVRDPTEIDIQSKRKRDENGAEFIAGAMLEIVRGSDGKPIIFQLRGPSNSDPASSIVQAINIFSA